ncbi:MAG: outer membrane beta-barrel protein [Ignavibacteriales bacterium]|nr:outer membrane beta-barrel protein [Ignavibacteriales bacterium]
MKYYLLALMIIACTFSTAQSSFSVYLRGSLNYTPMRGLEHDLVEWKITEIDRFNFSPHFGIKYSINEKHCLYLDAEWISAKLSYGPEGFQNHYTFAGYPVTFGYEYFIDTNSGFKPYLGAGISYLFFNTERTEWWTGSTENLTDKGFGMEVKFGSEYKLTGNFFITGEIIYRYLSDMERNNDRNLNKVNLSGLASSIGILFKM